MGNQFSIVEHRYDIVIIVGIIAIISYLINERQQKRQFREELKKQTNLQQQDPSNRIYFKDTVEHFSIRETGKAPIYKIAVTGGPCAGKTTSMERVKDFFSKKGFRVFSVLQIPTMVVLSGGMILMSKFNAEQRIKFQSLLIRHQMYSQDYITKLAEMSGEPSIVLCDRGTMDPQAYISKDEFQSIMDEEGWNRIVLRDRRYDRVCVLSSAANGAEEAYSLSNNVARHENIQQARALDKKTLDAWVGHPHLSVIPNVKGQTFDDKMQRVIKQIQKTVGIQIQDAHYPKILIRKPQFPQGLRVQTLERIDIILLNDNPQFDEVKVSKEGNNGSFVYQKKIRYRRENIGDFSRQVRRPLTSTQFVTLRDSADPKYIPLQYKRTRFAYNNIYYGIDIFNIDGEQHQVLRFFCKKDEQLTHVPQFCQVIRDVTRQKKFTVNYMSKKRE